MALGFNSNLFNTNTSSRSSETAGTVAIHSDSETAGSLASAETAGMIASAGQIDTFSSSNPFAQEIDYSQYANYSGDSVASSETAGSLAFDAETAGSLACGSETAGSVASGDSGCSFGSSDGGFVC